MFLNEDFIKLYEELSELNEAKADTQKLVDFAGEELANRFLTIKNRLKAPENDLYYWIKNKTPEELEQIVVSVETTKSKTAKRKEAVDGAELVNETEHWRIYHITTFEASQYYGRDTKWCITGVNGYGDRYWKNYTEKGVKFYFLVTKNTYDPRGTDSKIAISLLPWAKGVQAQIFNQQDDRISFDQIPYNTELTAIYDEIINKCRESDKGRYRMFYFAIKYKSYVVHENNVRSSEDLVSALKDICSNTDISILPGDRFLLMSNDTGEIVYEADLSSKDAFTDLIPGIFMVAEKFEEELMASV